MWIGWKRWGIECGWKQKENVQTSSLKMLTVPPPPLLSDATASRAVVPWLQAKSRLMSDGPALSRRWSKYTAIAHSLPDFF